MKRARVTLGSIAVIACLAACSDDDTDTTTTTEGAGASGAASSTGGMGGEASTGGAGGSACTAHGEDCVDGTTICCDYAGETGICFPFGMGAKCTIPCPADPADCPNEGAGCNNMTPSYCKVN